MVDGAGVRRSLARGSRKPRSRGRSTVWIPRSSSRRSGSGDRGSMNSCSSPRSWSALWPPASSSRAYGGPFRHRRPPVSRSSIRRCRGHHPGRRRRPCRLLHGDAFVRRASAIASAHRHRIRDRLRGRPLAGRDPVGRDWGRADRPDASRSCRSSHVPGIGPRVHRRRRGRCPRPRRAPDAPRRRLGRHRTGHRAPVGRGDRCGSGIGLAAIAWSAKETPWARWSWLAAGVTLVCLLPVAIVDAVATQVGGRVPLDELRTWGQAALSVLWAVLWRHRVRGWFAASVPASLRQAGSWLLALATAKVFLFDLSALDVAYRVVSLIALGLLAARQCRSLAAPPAETEPRLATAPWPDLGSPLPDGSWAPSRAYALHRTQGFGAACITCT